MTTKIHGAIIYSRIGKGGEWNDIRSKGCSGYEGDIRICTPHALRSHPVDCNIRDCVDFVLPYRIIFGSFNLSRSMRVAYILIKTKKQEEELCGKKLRE